MGCGQSKIGSIYPKNKKNKNNSAKKNGDPIRSASSVEQKNGNGNVKGNKTNNNGVEVNRNEDQNGGLDAKGQPRKKSIVPGGPLLQQAEISTSQLDFFRMLDEKIENGPDYDESLDTASRVERVSSLLRCWELASVSWSGVSDLNETTSSSNQKSRVSTLNCSRQNLSAVDREGMRNIVGGRPESAPIYMRNANRVDGLQGTHCPSPNMPRHVLESISQSPTQSVQTSTPPACPSPIARSHFRRDYDQDYNKDFPSPVAGQVYVPQNCQFVTQNEFYRDEYLEQTGIITPRYTVGSPGGNVLRNSSYVQHFQNLANPHFNTPRRRGFNTAQMT